MTTWIKDNLPSKNTSMIVGCITAGVAKVGDTTACSSGCDPAPVVEIKVSGSIDVNVTVKGFE